MHHRPRTGFLPMKGGWLALPVLAMLGGAWAFSGEVFTGSPTDLAIAAALVVGGWQPLWQILTQTDWATPLKRWRNWEAAEPLPGWPYLQAGTPGAALHQRLAQAKSWWNAVGRVPLVRPLRRSFVAVMVSVLLGSALGRDGLLLTLLFVTCVELATLWHEGVGEVGSLWCGIGLAGLPWLLGASLGDGWSGQATLSSLVLALVVGLYAHHSWWAILGPTIGALFLIGYGYTMAAGWLLMLALPGMLVLSHKPSLYGYRRAIGPWVLGMIMLMAWVL